jgi:hypothetical protein
MKRGPAVLFLTCGSGKRLTGVDGREQNGFCRATEFDERAHERNDIHGLSDTRPCQVVKSMVVCCIRVQR